MASASVAADLNCLCPNLEGAHAMRLRTVLSAVAVAAAGFASVASADPRPFTFVYDTYPEGKGEIEYEQWSTWRHGLGNDNGANRVDFRHEFEFGITDSFDLAVYVPNWHWEDSAERTGTRFDSVGMEAIVYLSNPVTDKIGSGLYFEMNVG